MKENVYSQRAFTSQSQGLVGFELYVSKHNISAWYQATLYSSEKQEKTLLPTCDCVGNHWEWNVSWIQISNFTDGTWTFFRKVHREYLKWWTWESHSTTQPGEWTRSTKSCVVSHLKAQVFCCWRSFDLRGAFWWHTQLVCVCDAHNTSTCTTNWY